MMCASVNFVKKGERLDFFFLCVGDFVCYLLLIKRKAMIKSD